MPKLTDPPDGGKAVIRSPLRLVHPAPPPKPKRRRGTARPVEDVFTAEEVAKLRLAIDNARKRFGSLRRLADAMGVHVDTVRLAGVRHTLTAGVAYRFARATDQRSVAGCPCRTLELLAHTRQATWGLS